MKNVYTVKAYDSHDRLIVSREYTSKVSAMAEAKKLAAIGAQVSVIKGGAFHVVFN
jgi:hypothetical protein